MPSAMRARLLGMIAFLFCGCMGPLVPVVKVQDQPLDVQQRTHRIGLLPRSMLHDASVKPVAHVESVSCQNKLWDPLPTQEDALEQLRFWALSYSADAVTDVTCDAHGTSTRPNCWEWIRCSGTAIMVTKQVAAR